MLTDRLSFIGGIRRVISRITILITHIRGLITLLITTHEPPSSRSQLCLSDDTKLECIPGLLVRS